MGAKQLRNAVARAQEARRGQIDRAQRDGLLCVIQTLTWALRTIERGVPAMDPVQAAMLGPSPSGGIRWNLEATMGPKVWHRSGFSVGAE